MKKIISILISLIAVVPNVDAKKKVEKEMSQADSIGYLVGRTEGAEVRGLVADRAPENRRDLYNSQFVAGFKAVLDADSTVSGYIDGAGVAVGLIRNLNELKKAGVEVSYDEIYKAFVASFTGEELTREQVKAMNARLVAILRPKQEAYRARVNEQKAREQEDLKAMGDVNVARGKAFIDSLKAVDKSVQTTASGLCYKVVEQGEGAPAGPKDKVSLTYVGRFIDGKEFDSSRGNVVSFFPGQVVSGFGEGLQLMSKGSKYILYIPSELAYGMNAPAAIGPGQTLVFEVDVVDIGRGE